MDLLSKAPESDYGSIQPDNNRFNGMETSRESLDLIVNYDTFSKKDNVDTTANPSKITDPSQGQSQTYINQDFDIPNSYNNNHFNGFGQQGQSVDFENRKGSANFGQIDPKV